MLQFIKISYQRLEASPIALILLSLFLVIILLGLKRYLIWDEMLYEFSLQRINGLGIMPYDYSNSMHHHAPLNQDLFPLFGINIHAPRILLMRPIFYIALKTKINYDLVFSINVICLLALSWSFLCYTLSSLTQNKTKLIQNGLLLTILIFSLFVNGRMIWSFFATSLLLWLYTADKTQPISPIIKILVPQIILLTCSVSTGSFIITFLALCLWQLYYHQKYSLNYSRLGHITMIISLFAWLPYFISCIIKNLRFFGGNPAALIHMLGHGYGHYLFSIYGLSVSLIMMALIYWRKLFYLSLDDNYIYYLVLLGVMGGCFGYSTVMFAIPCVMLLLVKQLNESRLFATKSQLGKLVDTKVI